MAPLARKWIFQNGWRRDILGSTAKAPSISRPRRFPSWTSSRLFSEVSAAGSQLNYRDLEAYIRD